MELLTAIDENCKEEIRCCLYREEMFQTLAIQGLENEQLGEWYVERADNKVTSILYIKDEGNASFTTFWVKDKTKLEVIAQQIKCLKRNSILLAGKSEYVESIFKYLGIKKEISRDIHYVYSQKLIHDTDISIVRKAIHNEYDISYIHKFFIHFFQPSSEEQLQRLINKEKISNDIEKGIFFVMHDNVPIGVGRYGSYTKNYIEFTTFYVEEQFRGQKYGGILLSYMISDCLKRGKTPILQTSSNNISARSLYKKLGFKEVTDYSFTFIMH
ncbi:Acetyltransferase (GNAT) family protein [Bacillus sp. 491mf]|uniref:GNAT family N-acetyltransferase n=1 Tax=Bacillus sp. 491mf TaxID=1761755 RepID=UPI0008E8A599|nr:GNAT family N-acetyltransferase [Bacillus sp. 491mf]SFC78109.1 Acetyltransferase (GNAT) family protein [Bacillus sp. 491mf]